MISPAQERSMRILRAADYRRMPWKNGGGETSEIAISPPGAALDDFDWRISMARVAVDGPFSRFPGIDRTLAILEGRGIHLAIAGGAPVALTAISDPVAFPGEIAASAALIDSPVTDLNVMTRRGRFTHAMRRLRPDTPADVAPGNVAPRDVAVDASVALLLCAGGSVEVAAPGGTARLGPRDSLLAGNSPRGSWRIAADEPSRLILIELWRVGDGTSP
jgi:environmental stress-induced protein Ves